MNYSVKPNIKFARFAERAKRLTCELCHGEE